MKKLCDGSDSSGTTIHQFLRAPRRLLWGSPPVCTDPLDPHRERSSPPGRSVSGFPLSGADIQVCAGWACPPRIVMKTPLWGRPSACGGLPGRPDGLSITYGGFSTARQIFKVHLMHNAGVGRHNGKIAEARLPPAQKRVSFFVPLEFKQRVHIKRTRRPEFVDL